MPEIEVRSDIKAGQHPSRIQGDSHGATVARNSLGALYIAEGRIKDLYAVVKSKSLLQQRQVLASLPKPKGGGPKIPPPLMHDPQLAERVLQLGTPEALAALKTSDHAITSLGEDIARLDKTFHAKTLAGKQPARESELRAWAARQEHPFQKLGAMMQQADQHVALVAAVLQGEAYLSNLSDSNQQLLRTMAESILAPDEVQARTETVKAKAQLESAAAAFTKTSSEIFVSLQSVDASAMNRIMEGASG